MLEETKIEFNLMYALRCGINSDNLTQVIKIFSANEYLSPDSYFQGSCSTLHYACSMGAVECVNYFIKECKCNVNSTNSPYAMPPVHMAAIHGKIDLIHLLHQSGADLNQTDNQGENILHKAVLTGDLNFVRNLVEGLKLENLLIKTDKNNLQPATFLKENTLRGLHPKQLSKDHQDNSLLELFEYLNTTTKKIEAWNNKKRFLQLRVKVSNILS
jgi:ankyrin repeat protein